MQAKITNGQVDTYPYSVGQLRRDNPNTSFPKVIGPDMLEEYGVVYVSESTPPPFDAATERLERDTVPHFEHDVWNIGWIVTLLSEEEMYENNWKVEEANRNTRNILLSQCDWTQAKDSPVDKEAWALYRQELRDITYTEAWPHIDESSWPIKPM